MYDRDVPTLPSGESLDAARAGDAMHKLEQQANEMQTLYPAGAKHWVAQWAREACQRARVRAGPA